MGSAKDIHHMSSLFDSFTSTWAVSHGNRGDHIACCEWGAVLVVAVRWTLQRGLLVGCCFVSFECANLKLT